MQLGAQWKWPMPQAGAASSAAGLPTVLQAGIQSRPRVGRAGSPCLPPQPADHFSLFVTGRPSVHVRPQNVLAPILGGTWPHGVRTQPAASLKPGFSPLDS